MTAPAPAAPAPIFHPNLPLSVIIESAHNPRKRYDADSLQELAETIRARGIHNPVLVREIDTPAGPRFELAAGHRRCRAARLVGLVEVPALIMQLDDRGFLELLHIDNLQRDGVDPLDEALAYEQLLSNGYDIATLADKLGRSITYVASRVRLLSLGVAAREAMQLGYVKVSHAIELAKLPEGAQEQLLESEWNLNPGSLARSAGVKTPAREPDAPDAGEAAAEAADEALAEEDDDEVDPEQFAPPKVTDRWLRARFYQAIAEPTLQTLKRAIAHDILRKLSVVPWDLNDATLVPVAGACATCPKRSSQEPLLFPELDREDACLDASCYEAKQEALWQLQRGLPKDDDGQSLPDWKARGTPDRDDRPSQTTPSERSNTEIDPYGVERVERKAAAARRQIGRSAAVQAVLAAVPRSALFQLAWLQQLFVQLLREAENSLFLDGVIRELQLEHLAPEGADLDDDSWHASGLEAWALSEERTVVQISRALIALAMSQELTVRAWALEIEPKALREFAQLVGIDIEAVAREAEARAEEDEEATAPAIPRQKSRRRRATAGSAPTATDGVQ